MTNVWCVRAEFGTYTKQFIEGGCVAIGWIPGVAGAQAGAGADMSQFSESVVAQAALAWIESTGWAVRNGAAIGLGEPGAERIIGRVC